MTAVGKGGENSGEWRVASARRRGRRNTVVMSKRAEGFEKTMPHVVTAVRTFACCSIIVVVRAPNAIVLVYEYEVPGLRVHMRAMDLCYD